MASVKFDIRADMGKDEEIGALAKIAGAIERAGDTYLSSLLRPELIEWVEYRIRNDFPPDLWEERQGLMADVNRLQDEVNTAVSRKTFKDLEHRLYHVKIAAKRSAKRILEMKREERRLRRVVDHYTADLVDARDLASDEHDRNMKLAKELGEARGAKVEAEEKTLRIKAKMYDLIEDGRREYSRGWNAANAAQADVLEPVKEAEDKESMKEPFLTPVID